MFLDEHVSFLTPDYSIVHKVPGGGRILKILVLLGKRTRIMRRMKRIFRIIYIFKTSEGHIIRSHVIVK